MQASSPPLKTAPTPALSSPKGTPTRAPSHSSSPTQPSSSSAVVVICGRGSNSRFLPFFAIRIPTTLLFHKIPIAVVPVAVGSYPYLFIISLTVLTVIPPIHITQFRSLVLFFSSISWHFYYTKKNI